MRITIEKIVYPGKSMGRGDDGIATFVEGGLAGETVDVEITRSKRTFREGNVVSVLTPSPLRIEPRCPSFGLCGGCSFQHTSYEQQLALKQAFVQELFNQLAVTVRPIVASPEVWGYRNKMEFSFSQSAAGLMLGLHKKGEFNRYFPVPPCYIADGDLMAAAEAVIVFAKASGLPAYDKRAHTGFFRHLVLRKGKRTGQVLVNLVTNADPAVTPDFFRPLVDALKGGVTSLYWTVNTSVSDAVLADKLTLLHGAEVMEEKMAVKGREYSFSISPFSFFQTNTLGAEKLYELVVDALGADRDDILLDLYCGTGTIGIVLSPYVGSVFGVEQIPDAVANAEANKRRNNVGNVSFLAGSVEKWIKHGEKPPFNALVLDPPRGGTSNKVIDLIAKHRPEKLVYVSCNPATLVRDLKLITEKAGYAVCSAVPVDMFPHTYHVETVVSFRKI